MAKTAKKAGRKCGFCGEAGHNARSCEKKQDVSVSADSDDDLIVVADEPDAAEITSPPPEPPAPMGEVPEPEPEPEPVPVKKAKKKAKKKASKPGKKKLGGLEAFAEQAEKTWPGSIAKARESRMELPVISTGNLGLDIATFGGLGRGRIYRFWGRPKSGKTGSCLNVVSEWQKHCSECFERGPCSCKDRKPAAALWIDAENRLVDMMYWVEGHDIDLDRLLILSPPTGQHSVDVADAAIRNRLSGIGLIVIDSVAHIVSNEELNKPTLDGKTIGRNAMLINSGLRKWVSSVCALGIKSPAKPTIVLINQIREKTGVFFGSSDTMPGGKGQDFATSCDIKFWKGAKVYFLWDEKKEEWVKRTKGDGGSWKPPADASPDYTEVNYRVTASGICPEGRYGTFNYWLRPSHDHRIGDVDNDMRLFDYAKKLGLVEKDGAVKRIMGHEARTFDELKALFMADKAAHPVVWGRVVDMLRDRTA